MNWLSRLIEGVERGVNGVSPGVFQAQTLRTETRQSRNRILFALRAQLRTGSPRSSQGSCVF